ncbi:MAG: aminotransferase class V-fold PLP-dependent enzyme, partial [Acidobacteriia bacterium]|nr:aminotransferase class V-fold PLP-dependent enzyme [Terriglobia bacterium]
IAGAIALGAALDYVSAIGIEAIAAHEADLLDYATAAARELPGLRLIGTASQKASILSFVLDGVHAHDAGTILDHQGVAVRAGHGSSELIHVTVVPRFTVSTRGPKLKLSILTWYWLLELISWLAAGLA